MINLKEVMKKQPIVNIGMIGHVSNGKSSVTKCITGIATQKYSDEKKHNITIKLGYANCKIYKCPECPEPECYKSTGLDLDKMVCKDCDVEMELINHLSICDVPGHNQFMKAMMNGTNVMDYTILIESVRNTEIPAPQTKEHLLCTTISQIPNVAICVNKLDLVKKEEAKKYISKLKTELIDTPAENSTVIPISASIGLNIDALLHVLSEIKPLNKKYDKLATMFIVRSFNINKCGSKISDLTGGIIGGSIISGTLKVDDEVIIKPGYVKKNDSGSRFKYNPIISKVQQINSEKTKLESAISGGLIGVKLDIDPGLTTEDGLIGCILQNKLLDDNSSDEKYKVFEDLELEFEKFRDFDDITEINDTVLVNVNSCSCSGKYIKTDDPSKIKIELIDNPVCVKIGDYCTISNLYSKDTIRIMGRGKIISGTESLQIE